MLTKLDIMDRGTDAVAVLKNETVPLALGFVGVVLRRWVASQVLMRACHSCCRYACAGATVANDSVEPIWRLPRYQQVNT